MIVFIINDSGYYDFNKYYIYNYLEICIWYFWNVCLKMYNIIVYLINICIIIVLFY